MREGEVIADNIADEALRRTFLENVDENAKTLALAAKTVSPESAPQTMKRPAS